MITEFCVAYEDTRSPYMDGTPRTMRAGVSEDFSVAERSLRIAVIHHPDARIEKRQVTEWEEVTE